MIWLILIAIATPLLFVIFYKRDVVANYAPSPPQPSLPPLSEQPKAELPAASFNFNEMLTASRFDTKPTDRPSA